MAELLKTLPHLLKIRKKYNVSFLSGHNVSSQLFTVQCYTECSISIACPLSVCDVEVS